MTAEARETWRHVMERVAVGFVLVWFGVGELLSPATWEGYIPAWLPHVVSPTWMILVHGWILFVLGALLALGLRTGTVSILSLLMLVSIVTTVLMVDGLTAIAVRDLGLTVLAASVALDRRRAVSWDAFERRLTTARPSRR